MDSFKIDFNSITRPLKVRMSPQPKAPYNTNLISITKDRNNRLYYDFEKPTTINIGGQKISDVLEYSVKKYQDAATDKGKIYNIVTNNSDITAYTHNDKFYMLDERFGYKKTMKIGNQVLKGDVSRQLKADGTQIYSAIGKNFNIKSVVIANDGKIIPPVPSAFSKMTNSILKKAKIVMMLLKF